MSISTIKTNIKSNLDDLVTSEDLSVAVTTDFKKDYLQDNPGGYPVAYLMPPSFESEVLDNRSVTRTYTFDIMVIMQGEDISGTDDIETLMETIVTKFDNDPTLGGSALGGVLPVSSAPEPFQLRKKDMIMFVVQIIAKEIVDLTFS